VQRTLSSRHWLLPAMSKHVQVTLG
jgi:hypothetical protein